MTKLFKYQKRGVKKLLKLNGRALLADEMGLGKTIQTLKYLRKCPKQRPVIIICPASVKYVWQDQAKEHTKLDTEVLESRTPYETVSDILIMNYEIVSYWLPYFKKIKPQVLILDEVHYQKNRKAKRTKAIRKLHKGIPHLICISGTPLLNRPNELFSTLNLLWPTAYPSFWHFAFKHCKPWQSKWGWNFDGSENMPLLHKDMKRLGMIRRLKKNVLKDLPDKIRTVVPLTLSRVNRKEYLKAETDFTSWLKDKVPKKAEKALRAEGLVKLGYLKRLTAQLKMDEVFQWVDDFLEESDEKLVLFCSHRKVIEALLDRYKKISVRVDGSVTGRKRHAAVNTFQTDPNVLLFLGNIRAAGEGITLTAASNLAFVELDFTPGKHVQAEDRIHRISQNETCHIFYLIAKGTLEEDLCKIIQKKHKIIKTVLDGTKDSKDFNIFNRLFKRIGKRN